MLSQLFFAHTRFDPMVARHMPTLDEITVEPSVAHSVPRFNTLPGFVTGALL